MDDLRRVAERLTGGEIVVTQKGEPVRIAEARGPMRITRGPAL